MSQVLRLCLLNKPSQLIGTELKTARRAIDNERISSTGDLRSHPVQDSPKGSRKYVSFLCNENHHYDGRDET